MNFQESLDTLKNLIREDLTEEEMNAFEEVRDYMDSMSHDNETMHTTMEEWKKQRRDLLFKGRERGSRTDYSHDEELVEPEMKEPEPTRAETIRISDLFGRRKDL